MASYIVISRITCQPQLNGRRVIQRNGTIKVTIRSESAFDIEATWFSSTGKKGSGSETDVPYKYDASSGDVTVIDTHKLKDLIKQIGAPIGADKLALLKYDGKTLHAVDLFNYPLTTC
ncbi:hypothetical protein FOZ60_001107 [Perkinsus olseni]|uniref:Uncharacterized protein n=1 Tax=Perkinsus olseni TaxID=32597 RepID=A0A7J6P142_PEROL|nr:hypothetical protein FOZ60_001107 [Perkinsus olseni]